jgi:hypothetical protein
MREMTACPGWKATTHTLQMTRRLRRNDIFTGSLQWLLRSCGDPAKVSALPPGLVPPVELPRKCRVAAPIGLVAAVT